MKWVSSLLVFIFLTTACGDDDEVLRKPPASEEVPSPASPAEIPDEVKAPLNPDPDMFQYGSINGLPYRILFPRYYDSAKSYPLHLFLHGIGERGSDNEKQLSVVASFYQADSIRDRYPSFIVFPQCPSDDYWFSNELTKRLKALIDTLNTQYQVVEEKISIAGFSMGAYGTFAMVARYPELFESAVAISGDGDHEKAKAMSETKWQIFAGKKDDIVPPNKTEKMAIALRKAGASVSYTLFPEADHSGTWFYAFSQPDLFYKLFSIGGKRPGELTD